MDLNIQLYMNVCYKDLNNIFFFLIFIEILLKMIIVIDMIFKKILGYFHKIMFGKIAATITN